MILDRRKPKQCNYCGQLKGIDDYNIRKVTDKQGNTILYCTSNGCNDCREKRYKARYQKQPKKYKRCHNCYKYREVGSYRNVKRDTYTIKSNWCCYCEQKYGLWRDTKEGYTRPPVNDMDKNEYHCAFIGNTPYKEICRVYGIRYEEPIS